MPENGRYLIDGDTGFIGLNTRDNPMALPVGVLSESYNMRLDRGVATARRGLYKYSDGQLLYKEVLASGVYINDVGQEVIIVLVNEPSPSTNLTQIYTYNPTENEFSPLYNLPVRINSRNGVSITYALNKVFITRGHNQRPIIWDLLNTFTILPDFNQTTQAGYQFPNCESLMFFQNRLIAIGRNYASTDPNESRYTVSVSHFLSWENWSSLDAFLINQGGNDEVIGLVPWTMNEFIVLMRNSAFYLNVGTSRYLTDKPLSSDAALFTLSTDVGCIARKTAVQVSNGVMFLSDNGVYFLQPNPSGNAGIKLLTLGEPVSATIDNIIRRINKNYAKNAVAAYWNNRYYLSVPIDDSEVNNVVLVYNFLLKSWESMDTYPETIDFMDFWVAKRNDKRRLFAVDSSEGILLTEEAMADYVGGSIGGTLGSPILPFILDETAILSPPIGNYPEFVNSTPIPINAKIITRVYTNGDLGEKRYSSLETDVEAEYGGTIKTTFITKNPDTSTVVDTYTSPVKEDATRRVATRKIAHGAQVMYETLNMNPTIRSNQLRSTYIGTSKISKQ